MTTADENGSEWWIEDLIEDLDRDYLTDLSYLQVELLKLQQFVVDQSARVVVLFEGRDTAGKGGTIHRFTQHLMPRHMRIVALSKPTETEKGQWYFQRYVKQLPDPGEIVFFDRSWYNRAVVEPVMGFCDEAQYQLFLKQVTAFESMLIEDGVTLIKFWFSIDRHEQDRRLGRRESNPLKKWKLSTVDRLAQGKWDEFTRYKDAMFAATSTTTSPWVIITGNDKKKARLESIRHVLSTVDYPDRGRPGLRIEPDSSVVQIANPLS